MSFVWGGARWIVMIGFMWGIYKNRRTNIGIVLVSVAGVAAALWRTRSQETVDDMSYLKAMIPHHSIAIMTSERAHIRDPKVRLLADRIIDAQVREIAEMKRHIARLETNPVPEGSPDLPSYRDKGVPPPPPETDESAGVDTLKPDRKSKRLTSSH